MKKNITKKAVANVGYLFLGNIVAKLISFITVLAIARKLGVENFGNYSFIISFAFIFSVFGSFGIDSILMREVSKAKKRASKYLGNVLFMKLILAIITLVISIAVIKMMNYEFYFGIYIMIFSIILDFFSNTFISLFRAFQKMKYESLLLIFSKIVWASFILVLLFLNYSFIILIFAFVISSTFNLILGSILCFSKITKPKFKLDIDLWKFLIKNSWPLGLNLIFMTLFFRIDIVLLSLIKGSMAVGIYSAAHKVIDEFGFIRESLLIAVFPMFCIFVHKLKNEKEIYKRTIKHLLVIFIPIAVGGTLLAEKIILFLYKEPFIDSAIVLKILIWAIIVQAIYISGGYLLTALNKQKLLAISSAFAVLINVVLNLILIPKYSYVGAAVSNVLTLIFLVILLDYFLKNYKFSLIEVSYKPAFAATIMGFFIYQFVKLNLFLVIISGAVIYIVLCLLLKVFTKEELKQLLPKKIMIL